jgi:hypothetical protein
MHEARAAFLLLALAAGAGAVYYGFRPRANAASLASVSASARSPAVAPRAAPDTIVDPLSPDHPAHVEPNAQLDGGDWVHARPGFQYSRKAAERGGVEPCDTKKLDSPAFDDWKSFDQGRYLLPAVPSLNSAGQFDLVIHLNGDEPVRRELIESGQKFVLYTLTIDPSQSYAALFTGSQLFSTIVSGLERALSAKSGKSAHVNHIAFSAWSAGFVGVEAALAQPTADRIDAVILIDGLHAPRNDDPAFKAQLKPFIDFAERAARGDKFMFVSHSSIDPPNFASTTECAHYLIASLGGRPQAVRRDDPMGLELVEYFSRGEFNVRGYAGNDKADHCAQLATLRQAFAALGRRWAAAPADTVPPG